MLLLQSEYGDIYKVTLSTSPGNKADVTDLEIKYFDTIAPCTSICVLRSGFLFAASEFSNHALYQFQVSLSAHQPAELAMTSMHTMPMRADPALQLHLQDTTTFITACRHTVLPSAHRTACLPSLVKHQVRAALPAACWSDGGKATSAAVNWRGRPCVVASFRAAAERGGVCTCLLQPSPLDLPGTD